MKVDVDVAIVWWSVRPARFEALENVNDDLGLKIHWRKPTPVRVVPHELRRILRDGESVIMRDGYAYVVEESRTEVWEPTIVVEVSAKEYTILRCDDRRSDLNQRIFNRLTLCEGIGVSAGITRYLHSIDGQRVRPNGGIYFIPPASMNEWRLFVEVMEKRTNTVFTMMTVRRNSDSMAAISRDVMAEAQRQLDELIEKIESTDSRADRLARQAETIAESAMRALEQVQSSAEGLAAIAAMAKRARTVAALKKT